MASELEITLNLDYVLVGRAVLLDHFKDADLELELLVELGADLEDLQGVVTVVLVVKHLEHLPEGTRA